MSRPFTFYEFFAGGGMARLGLGAGWECLFANDFDPGKAAAYRANFGGAHLSTADIHSLGAADLPGRADLAWASSPCQDFSLAGARAGLGGSRSSALLGFLELMGELARKGRAPRMLVIENVTGLLSARGGADFAALRRSLAELGYAASAVTLDASAFLPQSRPRVFVVASAEGQTPPLPAPPIRALDLAEVLEPEAVWSSAEDTARLLSLLGPANGLKLNAALAAGERRVGAAYRRVRLEAGRRVQRLELRFDGVAGCLRTPAGGSSRQFVIETQAGQVRSRRLTAREGARLMGLPEDFALPAGEMAAWRVVGDGVAVPVVAWLSRHVLEPALSSRTAAA
ncbi:MAG: DNA cytosine methyltransferase, partial [Pseudomonadota bacterium]|nr:DNA cytosine methyltransferase [Pseudomonadota bacterium]